MFRVRGRLYDIKIHDVLDGGVICRREGKGGSDGLLMTCCVVAVIISHQ